MKTLLCYLLFFLILPKNALADHIFGGDLSMQSLGDNKYRFSLYLYFDEAEVKANEYQNDNVLLHFFRKRDNQPVSQPKYVVMGNRKVVPIEFKNKACTDKYNQIKEVSYSVDVDLLTSQFNDPEGYYAVWERCCRNQANSNLVNPDNTPMAFIVEFPPVYQNGTFITNSSPQFSRPLGSFICLNKPFIYDMSATDADGDELRYSLITPTAGFVTTRNNNQFYPTSGRWPYPTAQWRQGFSATNAMPASQPLTIDPRTGIISVTATETGLYAFAVLIEEYRNGVRIGAIRREFQLPVIDCSKSTLAEPIVYKDAALTQPVQNIAICPNGNTSLYVLKDSTMSYLWQRNNVILPAETASSIRITQAGDYRVAVSTKQICVGDTISKAVKVNIAPIPTINYDTLRTFCLKDSTIQLSATPAGGAFSGNNVTNNAFSINKAGIGTHNIRYQLTTTDGCILGQNGKIVVVAQPTVQLATEIEIMRGEVITLNPVVNGAGYKFSWSPPNYLSGATLQNPVVKTPNTTVYSLTVQKTDGCSATARVRIVVNDNVLHIPTVFTPNNDANNDTWVIRNIEGHPNAEVFVYNRWGELIFYQKGYKNNWDGTYLGKPAPIGTYTYMVLTTKDNKQIKLTGSLLIAR